MKKLIYLLVLIVFGLVGCTKEVYVETEKPTLYEHSYEKQEFEPFSLEYRVVR